MTIARVLFSLTWLLISTFRSGLSLQLEIAALHHQLFVYGPKGRRPRIGPTYRLIRPSLVFLWRLQDATNYARVDLSIMARHLRGLPSEILQIDPAAQSGRRQFQCGLVSSALSAGRNSGTPGVKP